MPKKTTQLTNTEIKNAKAVDGDMTMSDGQGLVLVVKTSGSKTWRFRYSHPITGKRQTYTIGKYPAVTLAEARQQRDAAKVLLAQGIDPQENKRAARLEEERKRLNTFEKVARDWLEVKMSQPLRNSTKNVINQEFRKHIIPKFGAYHITDLTPQAVIKELTPLQRKGTLALLHVIVRRLNEIMDYAMNTGLIYANPLTKVGAAFIKPVVRNQPAMNPGELPELFESIRNGRMEYFVKLLFEWQLLTMTRPQEASGVRWADINLNEKIWTIPVELMKMKQPHTIPLSKQALAILEIMKSYSSGREHVFPSYKNPQKSIHSYTLNCAMRLRCEGLAGRQVSHGLRALASTTLNAHGFNPDVIEAALAHRTGSEVRSIYNRGAYFEQRIPMMQWWGDYVEAAKNGQVIPIDNNRGLKLVVNSY
ncbi:integrase arm-type DNA-binding domain-containing protein [Escherichia coli]|uniref:integrase arm-type DNA-binding domain-containing protein n=1 Tax=Citrobacter braakii TaxID=57706 RepID=UPI00242ECA6F|nr:integrase arm-type DNA-binding domain-containing protein [Citrobacter braakii]EKD2603954.1 integrase arm-type DNA-binding domain-containing protein [Escherichia coli]WGA86191.1 integrase arm-type DNA-binding domain-containing protein [Citrobacter braakii]